MSKRDRLQVQQLTNEEGAELLKFRACQTLSKTIDMLLQTPDAKASGFVMPLESGKAGGIVMVSLDPDTTAELMKVLESLPGKFETPGEMRERPPTTRH